MKMNCIKHSLLYFCYVLLNTKFLNHRLHIRPWFSLSMHITKKSKYLIEKKIMSSEDVIYDSSHRKGGNIQRFAGWVLKILHHDFYDKERKSFFSQTVIKLYICF